MSDPAARAALALPGLAALLACATILQGAFYGPQLAIVAVGFAALAVIVSGRVEGRTLVWAGLAALAVTLLASTAATGWPRAAVKPIATLFVAATAFFVAARAVKRDGSRALIEMVVAIAAVAAAIGIAGLAWHIQPLAFRSRPWRLQSTLTYQNAAASLFALVLAPAAAMAARGRVLHRVALCLIAIALVGTQSRGGILAAFAALVVLLALRGVAPARLLPPLLGAGIGVASLIPAMLTTPGYPVIATAGIALGVTVATVAPAEHRRLRAFGGVAVALAIAAAAVVPFTSIGGRFTLSSTDRARVWSATTQRFKSHLAFGTGPGTYRLIAPKDDALVSTEYAHNEYLQTLSETGLVGAAGVLLAIALFALALAWKRATADPFWAACCGSGVAFLVHSGLDFIWRIPLLVAIVFVLLAVGTAELGTSPTNIEPTWEHSSGKTDA